MSTETKKLNDNALNKWKSELYYCSKNFKNDKAHFNLDCLKNALCKVIELMHLDADSVDVLLDDLCSELSLDRQSLLLDNSSFPHGNLKQNQIHSRFDAL